EFAPGMRPAARLHDLPATVQSTIATIGVCLQDAAKALQVFLRSFAFAIRRVLIPDRRRSAAASRSIITHIGPQPPGASFTPPRIKNRHGRIVCVDLLGLAYVTAQRVA